MSICYLYGNYDTHYKCKYSIKKSFIEVNIDYDIGDEIKENGIIIWGVNTKFKERDILIADHQNKKNYLLKNAYYAGKNSVYGTPDGGSKTKFQARTYFEHSDLEKLIELQNMPKVTRLRIYSKAVNDLIGYPSLQTESSDYEYKIKLSRKKIDTGIELNNNGIKKIIVTDDWSSIVVQLSRHKFQNFIMNLYLWISRGVNSPCRYHAA